jgi:hypothetical protein
MAKDVCNNEGESPGFCNTLNTQCKSRFVEPRAISFTANCLRAAPKLLFAPLAGGGVTKFILAAAWSLVDWPENVA